MPTEIEELDEPQHSYFNLALMILVGIFVFNLLITILFSVFDFYNFDYSNFYSVIIFYLFMLSCVLILPRTMPYEDTGLENITSSIKESVASGISSVSSSMGSE